MMGRRLQVCDLNTLQIHTNFTNTVCDVAHLKIKKNYNGYLIILTNLNPKRLAMK
jgi:hypothetical protein